MSVYHVLTDRMAKLLDEGVVPWDKPGFPLSLATKTRFRGANVFLLAGTGRASPWWGSFDEIHGLGGRVAKGQHGVPAAHWVWATRDGRRVAMLRYHTVFNFEQCEDLDEPPVTIPPPPGPEMISRLPAVWGEDLKGSSDLACLTAQMGWSLAMREMGAFRPLGISPGGWAEAMRNDQTLAYKAGAAAQKAIDEALGRTWEK